MQKFSNKVDAAIIICMLLASCNKFPPPGEDFPAIPIGNELFYASYPYAFVSAATHKPVLINGVNLRHAPYRSGGLWQTDKLIQQEFGSATLGSANAPAFNAVRIPMSWGYFQHEDGSIDSVAFQELDKLIRAAADRYMYVILDPIHINKMGNPGGVFCSEDPVMANTYMNIPDWAWREAGYNGQLTCGQPENEEAKLKMLDVLCLQKTANYLSYILQRYNSATELGKWVIAVDLVNEPHPGDGTADVLVNKLIEKVYIPWLDATNPRYIRGESRKILIFTPPRGDMSLADASGLSLLAKHENVVFTLHDYFGGLSEEASSPTYGLGYSPSGWPTRQKHSYSETFVYEAPYDLRYEEHRTYIQQYTDWLHPYRIPLYIGEYGFNKKNNPDVAQWIAYTSAARRIYDSVYVVNGSDTVQVQLPRTYWTHGQDDPMALWNKSTGQYYPHAWEATGEAPH